MKITIQSKNYQWSLETGIDYFTYICFVVAADDQPVPSELLNHEEEAQSFVESKLEEYIQHFLNSSPDSRQEGCLCCCRAQVSQMIGENY